MNKKNIYRIQFINQDKVYEVYAQNVGPSGIPGFIEVGKLAFGEKSPFVLDPSEESLKNEFSGVKRSYIPMHCVIRIDEVEKQGAAKISQNENNSNIRNFPAALLTPPKPDASS